MVKILVGFIKTYQKILSPDHSWLSAYFPHGYCRYTPSCSQYAIESLLAHGAIKGVYLSLRRVLRCNPWADFGPDPVPANLKLNAKDVKSF